MSVESYKRSYLVVDDEAIVRELLVETLLRNGHNAMGAPNAAKAVAACRDFDPDCVLIDVDLGGGSSGKQLLTALAAINPNRVYIFLTNFLITEKDLREDIPVGYLDKRKFSSYKDIEAKVDEVIRGSSDKPSPSLPLTQSLGSLPARQIEAIKLVASGYNNAQIARELEISEAGVEQLLRRAYRKLGLSATKSLSRRSILVKMYLEQFGRTF